MGGHTTLSIGEVARRAGVRTSALRYYETAGLLPPPRRDGGRRRYEPAVLRRLAVIRVAQQAGYTIAELRTLLQGFGDTTAPAELWRGLAERKLVEIEELIQRARGMQRLLRRGLACRCVRWEECGMIGGVTASRNATLTRDFSFSRGRQ